MRRLRFMVVLAIGGLLLVSGCVFLPGGDDPRFGVELTPIDVQTGDFDYSGQIRAGGNGRGCIENTTISLYTAEKERIKSKTVGRLCFDNQGPSVRNVTLHADTQPKYIIIESESFWDDPPPAYPGGYVRRSGWEIYDEYPIEEQGQIEPRGVHEITSTTTYQSTSLLVAFGVVFYRARS